MKNALNASKDATLILANSVPFEDTEMNILKLLSNGSIIVIYMPDKKLIFRLSGYCSDPWK